VVGNSSASVAAAAAVATATGPLAACRPTPDPSIHPLRGALDGYIVCQPTPDEVHPHGDLFGGAGYPLTPPCAGAEAVEALRRDLLTFHDQHEDALADLIVHLSDGQAVLASYAIVEARLPMLLSVAEPLGETDPALLVDDQHCGQESRAARVQHQVRLSGLSRSSLCALLRWAYGEIVPRVGDAVCLNRSNVSAHDRESLGDHASEPSFSLEAAFDLLEACDLYGLERLSAQLREAVLESLDVRHFAEVLRESHLRNIHGLKKGCMRFALHHFDELVDRPEVFVNTLQELPEVVTELFRLGRRWKDDLHDCGDGRGRTGALRSAPAPPSTYVGDFERLYAAARLAEERGKSARADREEEVEEGCERRRSRDRQDLAPDCRVVVGEDIYLGHSVVLASRSDFFLAAFSSEMAERSSLLVTLQHVQGDAPRRESVLALLHFLYTGKTREINGGNAMEVLALVGGESAEDCGRCDSGGYLQLHDAMVLRRACEIAAEHAALRDETACLALLVQAHALGAGRLRESAMRLAVHYFKDLALRGAFEALPPPLLTEVLRRVAIEYDNLLPSAAKGARWELSMLPAPDGRLENTYEAVSSPDLSCGAGASGAVGCSEASLVATFDRLVRVRRIRIGVDLTIGDFDAARLNGSRLQYLSAAGIWQDGGVEVSVEDGVVRDIELPQVLVARSFRLVRRQRLAVGLLAFE